MDREGSAQSEHQKLVSHQRSQPSPKGRSPSRSSLTQAALIATCKSRFQSGLRSRENRSEQGIEPGTEAFEPQEITVFAAAERPFPLGPQKDIWSAEDPSIIPMLFGAFHFAFLEVMLFPCDQILTK